MSIIIRLDKKPAWADNVRPAKIAQIILKLGFQR